MNFGGLKNQLFAVALIAFVWTTSGSSIYAQQETDSRQQLSQQQTDRLAQLGGQSQSQPRRPFGELSQEEQEYLVKVLDFWQEQSAGINLYECSFDRKVYDTGLTNYRDPQSGNLFSDSIAMGVIRYGKPGKALYETNSLYKFVGVGNGPKEYDPYKPVKDATLREKWVTDGEAVYEFDFQAKRLYETKLPPDMRGDGAVTNSPIPFMFGARKDQILQRYWVRVITPPGAKDEVWLEAWPKRAEDAQNYLKVEIILSIEPFLPKAVHMYMPQYNPKKNNLSSVYIAFSDRKVNDRLAKIKNFWRVFVKPSLPKFEAGWKMVPRQQMNATAAGAQPDRK
jgi:TIGR03009 family protein